MRALVMSGFGSTDEARLVDVAKPVPGPDDVIVKMMAASVNPADWKEAEGTFAQWFPPYPDPWILGLDGAGIVESVGGNVTGVAVGDKVMFFAERPKGVVGTFVEFVRTPAALVAPIPRTASFEQAAAIPCAGVTGFQALFAEEKADLKPGQSVLIHGASGAVGSFDVAFAKAAGLKVAATCRSANAEYVRGLGADLIIDYQNEDIVASVREWMPEGVDVVLDCVSAGSFTNSLDALKPGGKLVSIMTATDDGDVAGDMAKAAERGFTKVFAAQNYDAIRDDLKQIADLIDRENMPLPEITCYPLEKAVEALSTLRKGKVRGKLVVKIAQ
jgi:NADPH2:quinone reductase